MTKEEHIKYWINTAKDDYDTFIILFNNDKYLYAFYLAHLTLEKIIKAHWVKDNEGNIPPKSHNLIYLHKNTKLELSNDEIKFLTKFNDFQIQGRYPDYQFEIQKLLTNSFSNDLKIQFEEIRKCLLNKIQ